MMIPPYRFEEWRKNGILCCGYEGCYGVAEAFMRRVVGVDSVFEIILALDGKNLNIDEASYSDFLNSK